MSRFNKDQGDKGELLAIDFLRRNGYKIIEQKFRTRNGEIDIIAVDNSTRPLTLCFIEVKTRSSVSFGTPFESIGYHKLSAMHRTAELYKLIHPKLPSQMRLDAISILLSHSKDPEIAIIKNIG